MYTALYRAYRPEVFDQLLGQEHIARILKNQIASGTTSHAYLFCGTRGTGKTTTARLLAKGLNCLSDGERPCGECAVCKAIRDGNYLDVVEIDAASNRSIEDIRQLRESVNYPPAEGKHKVYIIDEVHMLSAEAFNALLKTLEEPPEYVTFILATTEPRKLPATILSRCLRLDFKRIPEPVLIDGMRRICGEIGIQVSEPALRIIAANADGSVRDGLSILDQCISGGEKQVDTPQVLELLGASGETVFIELTDLVSKRRTGEAIEYLGEVLADGKDVRQLIRDWVIHYRNLMMTKFIRDPQPAINLSVENIDRVREQSSVMQLDDITRGIMELSKVADQARWSTQPRILLEVCIVNLCQGAGGLPPRRKTQIPAQTDDQPAPKAPAPKAPAPKAPVKRQAPAAKAKPAAPDKAVKDSANDPAIDSAADPAESSTLSALDAMIAAAEHAPRQSGAAETQAETNVEQAEPEPLPDEQNASAEPMPEHDGELSPEHEAASNVDDGQENDLARLWDEVFADGEHRKGSIYLIRSNGMLTDMDEGTFTISVDTDLIRRQTERSRKLLEDLMEERTGQRRHMHVEVRPTQDRGEISAEEAAARASEVLGTEVTLE